jgi:cell division protein ZapE
MVTDGSIRMDRGQLLVAEMLQQLSFAMARFKPPDSTSFWRFFPGRNEQSPRGLYIFGGVGCGKTMLMDLFFAEVDFTPKRRWHFQELMQEVHASVANLRRKGHDGDPILKVAANIAHRARLLCVDEFQVSDITDAMILSRLFATLFAENVVVVATSNTPVSNLYANGLNRKLFEPFIEMARENMDIIQLESLADYRQGLLQAQDVYHVPHSDSEMTALWKKLSGNNMVIAGVITVNGRKVTTLGNTDIMARFLFSDICGKPLGSADYRVIADKYATVFVEDIPVMLPHMRNEARRFTSLVDVLYDNENCLIVSAATTPDKLYTEGSGAEEFKRTASRLVEMRSAPWLS